MKKLIYLFWYVIALCSASKLAAQRTSLSKPAYQALNNYIEYSNEIVHSLHILHDDFEYLNIEFNRLVEQETELIPYEAERVLTNYNYFPVLPRDLYQDIFDDNIYIPYNKRGKPLQLVGKLKAVVDEVEDIRQQLDNYITSGAYRTDTNLAKGFEWLRRIEVLYYDVYALQEKLHWSINLILKEYGNELSSLAYQGLFNELETVLNQSKRLLRAVRAQDRSAGLAADCAKMQDALDQLKRNQQELLEDIEDKEDQLVRHFEKFLNKGYYLLDQTQTYLSTSRRHYGKPHLPYYYYYNNDLLSNYNRYGNGLTAMFNKMVRNSEEKWLWADELPPIYEVIYPEHPAFDSLRRDSLPDPEWFLAQLEKNRQDSINREDSLAQANPVDTPKVGDPSLKGFATNNLIFLIDISSSMKEKEKLPLLKASMEQLLDLMRPEDNITVITYSQKAEMILSPTSAQYKGEIMEVLNDLEVRSTSDADKGLEKAYLVARESYMEGGNNRIILSTDGNFKLSKRSLRRIRRRARQNIKLSVFYYSPKIYSHVERSLKEIADLGKGRYSYITEENVDKSLLIEAQSVRKDDPTQ